MRLMPSFAAVRGAKAKGTETTPAKLDLNPAVGFITQQGSKAMATKKKKKKKKTKTS